MPTKYLNFISGNPNKLSEVRDILGDTIQVKSTPLDLIEIQGSSQDIALDKCRRACNIVKGPVLVEDTALYFNALNGLPGPYIKWFLRSLGHAGLNNLLLAYEDKTAVAVCTFVYCEGPGQEPILFEGRALGKIVAARGAPGFGWDPIFEYEGETYAEMKPKKKNSISHRSLALSKLRLWFETNM